jgi:succinyl-diaminopimelate desuccinylase
VSSLAERALALVKVPSVIGNEQAIADLVEQWARSRFAPSWVTRVSHSLVVGDVHDLRPMVLLVGHLDTVPAAPQANPPRIEGGRLFGLGASDMKGSLAVMFCLMESLDLPTVPVNVVLMLYEREEGPYLASGLGPLFEAVPQVKRAAFAIAMEPTDGAVQVGCVGTLHAKLTFEGRAAHSARPWQGKNAIHAAGPLLAQLDAMVRTEVVVAGFSYFEVMSATLASGGRAPNVVPDAFELNLNYRFAPGKTVEQAQADVMAFVAGRAHVTFTDLAPSGAVCADNPYFIRLVRETARPAQAKQAWTDVARFSQLGIDAVNFGPGETAQAHQRDESAGVAALGEAYEVLSRVLTSPGV